MKPYKWRLSYYSEPWTGFWRCGLRGSPHSLFDMNSVLCALSQNTAAENTTDFSECTVIPPQ